MARITRQALTSIGGFVIIALIAAALIIGVVLVVKDRAEQARRAEAVKVAQQQAEDQAADQAANSDETDDSEAASNTEAANPDESSAAVQTATELPVTGPENSLLQLVAVSVLAISSSLYIASRKAVRAQA